MLDVFQADTLNTHQSKVWVIYICTKLISNELRKHIRVNCDEWLERTIRTFGVYRLVEVDTWTADVT